MREGEKSLSEGEHHTGRLIVVYGVNNLGKSTQLNRLVDSLAEAGQTVERRKYPRYESPSGQIVNGILRGGQEATPTQLQQWASLNIWQDQRWIDGQIESGQTVVLEGYWGETLAWGMGGGVPREEINAMILGLRSPELAIVLLGERFTEAREDGHRHEEDDDLTARVQEHHRQLAEEFGWHTVFANGSVDEVHEKILSIVNGESA